jgi:hypothetical protein
MYTGMCATEWLVRRLDALDENDPRHERILSGVRCQSMAAVVVHLTIGCPVRAAAMAVHIEEILSSPRHA